MIERLAAWMKMRPRQLVKAIWLGAVLLAITGSYTLVKTARDTVFLSQLPVGWLPYVYLLVGISTLLVSWVFGRVMRRSSPLGSLVWASLVSAAGVVVFALLFPYSHIRVPVGFYLWVNAYGLIVTSQFWAYAASVTDPQEAKRIYGIVGGGAILGGLVGGLLAAWLGPRVPIAWIAGLGAASLGLVAPVLWFAVREGRVAPAAEPEVESEQTIPLARMRYVRWLAIAMLCSVIVTGLLDFQMKTVVQRLYPTAPQLAGFFGKFHVAVGVVALAFQLVGTRWLLQRLGAGWSALVLPAGLVLGTASALLRPGFYTVVGTRIWDQVVRFSLNKSAVELFYFPLEAGLRRRAKALIEAGIERFGDAMAGIVILALGFLLEPSPEVIAAVACMLVLAWLASWWHLRTGYVRELARSLRRMNPDAEHRVSLRELSVLKELVRMLESPYETLVLQAWDLLEENAARLVDVRLPQLLEHRSARVRARALARVAERHTERTSAQVEGLLRDADPKVRLQALRTLVVLGQGPSLARLQEFLDHPDPEVRGPALACMVELSSDAEMGTVRSILEERSRPSSADRVLAVRALGARTWPSPLHQLLEPLYDDEDIEVRRAALESLGQARIRDQVPRLVTALGDPETQATAQRALQAFGEGLTGTLGDWLCDTRVAIEIRRLLPRVLAEIPSATAIAALYRCRVRADLPLLYRILKASNRIRVANRALAFPVDLVTEDLRQDVIAFLKAERHVRNLGSGEDVSERFLSLVLLERMDQAFNRVFRRLALLYPPEAMFSAYLGLLSANARVRGSAVEYVETALSAEHRALVLPVLPQATPEQRRELAESVGIRDLARSHSLETLLQDEDPWLRTCALYVVGRRRQRSLAPVVEANLDAADPRVRETAHWALETIREAA